MTRLALVWQENSHENLFSNPENHAYILHLVYISAIATIRNHKQHNQSIMGSGSGQVKERLSR